MSLTAAFAALLLTTAPQEPTVATAQHLLFERCPAALRDGTTETSETVETLDGFAVFWGVSIEDRACNVFVQWRVDDSLSAIRSRLEAEDWIPAGTTAWTREDWLLMVSRFEEDGVPGATVILAEAEGPLGAKFAAHRERGRRPLIQAARRALFDLCPVLAKGEETAQSEIMASEPELFGLGAAADPAEGQIEVEFYQSACTIKLSGPAATQTVDALIRDAQARGYVTDAQGRLWAEDWVILPREGLSCPPKITGCPLPFFNVQLFDRVTYESVVDAAQTLSARPVFRPRR